MSSITLNQALQVAIAHHQAGQLPQAEALYRQILAVQPQHPDALHLLGVIASQVGQPDAALELIAKAIAVQPGQAAYHTNLGEAHRALGQLDQAIACYRRALTLAPNAPETHNNLGIALYGKGQTDEAIASYERAIALRPDYAEAHSNLGNVWAANGQWEKAIASCRRAVALRPDFAEAHNNLGTALKGRGQGDEAIASFERAVALRPDYAEALNGLGAALSENGRLDEAIACLQQAVSLQPNGFTAYNNLGTAFYDKGQLGEAIACYRQALALQPDSVDACLNLGIALVAAGQLDEADAACRRLLALQPDSVEAYNNLGNACKDQARIEEALEAYREAIRLKPQEPARLSALLFALHLHPGYDARALLEEHQRWEQQHGKPRRRFHRPHANTPDPDKRLKIGYVSPSLWLNPVGRFLLPLFENHDHAQFEIFCYADFDFANFAHQDSITTRLRARAAGWRETTDCDEEQMADCIREDGIDVLVDLSLHTGKNRLPVFAHKPAPVQVTWLSYCSTSGLDTMDFRLTDPYLDPPGSSDADYSETSVRLPDTYWCYPPPEEAPDILHLPALSAGHVTFGCLNSFSKVNPQMLAVWAGLLRKVPDARLVLSARPGSHRERVRARLATEGVSPERVCFVDSVPLREYFASYGQTDIALDPFPYAGGTTTCDALWMGVPVVTLAGKTGVGRGGVSILSNIGLPELIAHTEDEYVEIAVEIASDLPRLAELRATLRTRMLASPLMDGPRFARGIEAAYRKMWTNWCQGRPLK